MHLEDAGLNLVVAHLNHSLRGADSDGDEEFVSELAAGYGLPFLARRTDVAALAVTSKLSLEDAGRRARYDFLREAALRCGATSIALAHHQDDQAETVLMRLLRGSGGAGLCAMAAVSGEIYKRPLLQVSRKEIEQYLKARGISYRTDATNADTAMLRNSVRHELIPFLKKYNPRVSERLAATAEILAADEELLEQVTAQAYARLAAAGENGIEIDLKALAAEPRGLRLRIYRRALLERRGDLQRIALTHLDAVDGLVTSSRPNARVKLPGACSVQRSYDTLRFGADEADHAAWELTVAGEGSFELPSGALLTVRLVDRPAQLDPGSRQVAYLDRRLAPFPWLVRTFLPGDRVRPLGMSGEQKVKDLFINEKIPSNERRRLPLLVSDGRVVWIPGVRMSEDARVRPDTERVVRVEILDFTP